ncbi:MAG: type II toxin-antitoxin system RelE/ParE family toxin [Planctomycetota bacterium]
MAAYSVVIRRSAEKEIARLPDATRRLIVHRIRALGDEPRPHGSQKLSGREGYRIRQGEYRVVYTIDDAHRVVTVVRVAHRSDVYR